MSDLIRREEVIEALKFLTDEDDPYDEGYNLGLNTAILEVKKRIPTADNSISLLPNNELLVDTEYTDQVESVRLMNCEGFTRVFNEPKVGRWIKLDETETLNESYTCSQCGYRKWVSKVRFLYEPKLVLNYCPNCGAKMERSE